MFAFEKYRIQSGSRTGEKRISSPVFSPRRNAAPSSARSETISAPTAASGSTDASPAAKEETEGGESDSDFLRR